MSAQRTRQKIAFGDFQTPTELARRVCDFLSRQGVRPASILEPTCGTGNFLLAALDQFTSANKVVGVDINSKYVEHVRTALTTHRYSHKATVFQGDFFDLDWKNILAQLPKPLLVIGNPPWVTSSELAGLGSSNLPEKVNSRRFSGLDAKTGKSNFDISEWMLTHILEQADGYDATLAMLCKTAVARKTLVHAWKNDIHLGHSCIYLIDAQKIFGASVDACLFVCHTAAGKGTHTCHVYNHISHDADKTMFGFIDNRLIADIKDYERWKHLQGENRYRWRSGIKHDSSKVMELTKTERGYWNGLGELYELEDTYIYPMLKSSNVAKTENPKPSRWMLVTQSAIGEDTAPISYRAPETWAYLLDHSVLLDKRKSSIYKNRPRFSIFGVGEYSFAPWKVAISGLYKKLRFAVVGPHLEKPVVLDDTCYFIPCQSEAEVRYLAELLNSKVAQQFYQSFIFWDAKRPITAGILNRLDLVKLARELGSEDTINSFLSAKDTSGSRQLVLDL